MSDLDYQNHINYIEIVSENVGILYNSHSLFLEHVPEI